MQMIYGAKPVKVIEMPFYPELGQVMYLPEKVKVIGISTNSLGPVIVVMQDKETVSV